MTGDQLHLTNRLSQFIAGSQWEAIPTEVRREGARAVLNFVGCALGGAHDGAMGIAVKVLTPFFGPPQGIVNRRALRVRDGDERRGRSRIYNRRARRTLGGAGQRVQALSAWGCAVPGNRRLSRTACPSRAGARSDRPHPRARPPADARAHRPAECRDRAGCQGQPAGQRRRNISLWRRRARAIQGDCVADAAVRARRARVVFEERPGRAGRVGDSDAASRPRDGA